LSERKKKAGETLISTANDVRNELGGGQK